MLALTIHAASAITSNLTQERAGEVAKVRIYQWEIRRGKPRHNIRAEGTDGAPPDSLHSVTLRNITLHKGTPEQEQVIPFPNVNVNVNVTGNFTTDPDRGCSYLEFCQQLYVTHYPITVSSCW